MTLLVVDHASVGYARRTVLSDVSFTLSAGTICCLLGANGGGKTTLMRSILGLLALRGGEITLDGIAIRQMSPRERACAMAWVPQAHEGAFAFNVIDMVLMGRSPHLNTFTQPTPRDREIALTQLSSLGIAHLAGRSWSTLSGGERQLTLIARALVQQPRLLLLDEPASSLDFGHQIRLLDVLRQLRQHGVTLLMATHHPLHARVVADQVIRVEADGRVSSGAPQEQLRASALAELYGVTPAQIHHHLGHSYFQG
ncbi:ABC transporter ATP-binding protein [Klebsiella indica]|uniref:ABC transporter ATP-binding protein n=1 Tax=Klebsiella TaxID=570 RepID=UPI002803804C|nr:ABC transporter ATP-binding protein [uncultured Klebsiella sp.]